MQEKQLMEYTLIQSRAELIDFRKYLHDEHISTIGMDFEAEYNLHEYGERLCLVQVNAQGRLFLIDPFEIDGEEIRATLETPHVVKIFFDASSDAALVRRQYDASLGPVLDLRIVAESLGTTSGGLGALLHDYFGIEVEKKARFQTYNWTRRPLSRDALRYALEDVRYLIELKDKMLAQIGDPFKIERLIAAHLKQCAPRRGTGRRRTRLEHQLSEMSVAERRRYEIIDRIRDGFAKIANKPKDQIVGNRIVVGLAAGALTLSDCPPTKALSQDQQRMLLETMKRELRQTS